MYSVLVFLFQIFTHVSLLIIMAIMMGFSFFLEMFLRCRGYSDYHGNVEEERCPICLEDFSEDKPIVLPVCSGRNGPTHFFHEKCILKHSEHYDHCPICRKMFKSDRFFKLDGVNTNRYDMQRFNDQIRNFEYR